LLTLYLNFIDSYSTKYSGSAHRANIIGSIWLIWYLKKTIHVLLMRLEHCWCLY